MKLLTIIGTRPEAIKMAPVLRALGERPAIAARLAATGQHPDLVDGPLDFFGLRADVDLALANAGVSPPDFVAAALPALDRLLADERPDKVLVHGDTASAMAAAQAAFDRGIPVGHVEAGLRTRADLPWPEEPFRIAIDALSDQLFAPTAGAADNLRADGAAGRIHVTGNSGVDALHYVLARLAGCAALRARADRFLPPPVDRPLILVTLHRRENLAAAPRVCAALAALAADGGVEIAFPIHPNPHLVAPILDCLAATRHVHLLPPLPFTALTRLLQRSALVLTDSGGLQEEAAALGKFTLVLRDATERPEGVEAGLAALVGTDPDHILAAARAGLTHHVGNGPALPLNPYGDGRAAERIVAGLLGEMFVPFAPLPARPALLASA